MFLFSLTDFKLIYYYINKKQSKIKKKEEKNTVIRIIGVFGLGILIIIVALYSIY